jgi:hypothetical protein
VARCKAADEPPFHREGVQAARLVAHQKVSGLCLGAGRARDVHSGGPGLCAHGHPEVDQLRPPHLRPGHKQAHGVRAAGASIIAIACTGCSHALRPALKEQDA